MPTSRVGIESKQTTDDDDNGSELKQAANDDSILFGNDDNGSTEAAKQFRNMLLAPTMQDILEATSEGMQILQMKSREEGSITKDQKFKSLSERWFVKAEPKDDSLDNANEEEETYIETRVRTKYT